MPLLSDSEEAGDVCLYCSEWLTKTLLCSCQVPSSSSTNSSPSGGKATNCGNGKAPATSGNTGGQRSRTAERPGGPEGPEKHFQRGHDH